MATPSGRLGMGTYHVSKATASSMGLLVQRLAPFDAKAQRAPALPPEKTVEVLGQKIRDHEADFLGSP